MKAGRKKRNLITCDTVEGGRGGRELMTCEVGRKTNYEEQTNKIKQNEKEA
jgi:hypothetical protein